MKDIPSSRTSTGKGLEVEKNRRPGILETLK